MNRRGARNQPSTFARSFIFMVLLIGGFGNAVASGVIRSVAVDHQSLNVAAAETVTVIIDFASRGAASVIVVDRDGYVVRTLATAQPVAGKVSFGWDGRDDSGQLVPDEAYSFKIDWRGARGQETYFPADAPVSMTAIDARAYDRRTATLAYVLPRPSRVHIQAGTAVVDPKTRQPVGPVMKTIVNRAPRAGGAIAEHWNGHDESGAIFIPDLENFVVAIAASPLPENSVITFGNRQRMFVDTLSSRTGVSLFTPRQQHEHHAALRTEDDLSPALKIESLNAVWSAADRAWVTDDDVLRLRLAVDGPTAAAFRRHPSTVELFIDGRRIGEPSARKADMVTIPLGQQHGTRRVSVNWNSDWGPVAANTIQVRVGSSRSVGGTR